MQDSHLTLNNAVEVVGKVQHDLTVKVFQAMDFGPNIGMFQSLFSSFLIRSVPTSVLLGSGYLYCDRHHPLLVPLIIFPKLTIHSLQTTLLSKLSWTLHTVTRKSSTRATTKLLSVRPLPSIEVGNCTSSYVIHNINSGEIYTNQKT
jgi:hypothetical protein